MSSNRQSREYDDFDYIGRRNRRDLGRFARDEEEETREQSDRKFDAENERIFSSRRKNYEGSELLEHYTDLYRSSRAVESARSAVADKSREDDRSYSYRRSRAQNSTAFAHRGPAGNGSSGQVKKRKKKKSDSILRKAIMIGGGIASAVILFFIVYYAVMGSLLKDINIKEFPTDWNDDPHDSVASIELRDDPDVTNILLLGVDSNGDSGSRADTIMIVSITKEGIRLTSILRDSYVYVPGHGRTKINHSYAYGGAELTMRTIESNYRIRIDEYISIDMESLVKVIAAVGGVTMEITDAEAQQINNYLGCNISGGVRELTAEQAVYYSRIRKIDSDFARTGRQRKLISALIEKCKSLGINELMAVATEVSPYLTTNMSQTRIATVALGAVGYITKPFEQLTVPIEGTYSFKTVSGMSVLSADLEENTKQIHEFIFG
ncbi:MAG: LytR family transcriptional regulator [Ruminococcaceae bacterium]|nr:LytR family transcriptional regulator [Oscillospiraceae bacterium]